MMEEEKKPVSTEDERRSRSQLLHKQSQEEYDKTQNALCFVVIGGMLTVIGILFYFLANRREMNQLVGLDVHSVAFYIFVISLGVGVVLLTYGLIRFFMAQSKRKKIIKDINSLK